MTLSQQTAVIFTSTKQHNNTILAYRHKWQAQTTAQQQHTVIWQRHVSVTLWRVMYTVSQRRQSLMITYLWCQHVLTVDWANQWHQESSRPLTDHSPLTLHVSDQAQHNHKWHMICYDNLSCAKQLTDTSVNTCTPKIKTAVWDFFQVLEKQKRSGFCIIFLKMNKFSSIFGFETEKAAWRSWRVRQMLKEEFEGPKSLERRREERE